MSAASSASAARGGAARGHDSERTEPKLAVRPLSRERWPDLETIFNARGCSVARGCWCMCYRRSGGAPHVAAGCSRAEANRAELEALVASGISPGLIGYERSRPVGWVSLGPREEYARLARSPVMKPVDAQPVWSIVCFVVPAEHRGRGVARALLGGAIGYAKRSGAQILEAYPVDVARRVGDDSLWFGTASMYRDAGFEEVARRRPARPVMRLRLR